MHSFSSPVIHFTDRADEIPDHVFAALHSVERNANVILPIAHANRTAEREGNYISERQLWMWTDYQGKTDFILSCTKATLGSYPIFIITTLPTQDLHLKYTSQTMFLMAEELTKLVPISRVYSVFAPSQLANHFAKRWSSLTNVVINPVPYYDAKISYCTLASLSKAPLPTLDKSHIEMRPTRENDLDDVAKLCKGFGSDNGPFFLTEEDSRSEAAHLIRKRQIWGLWIHTADASILACIVAFTRVSKTVATITKVYTDLACRRRGCAERLTRRVCKELLKTKKEVALYVGNDNPAAKVYARVGFVGLKPDSPRIEGVDKWSEIGFDDEQVVLGLW